MRQPPFSASRASAGRRSVSRARPSDSGARARADGPIVDEVIRSLVISVAVQSGGPPRQASGGPSAFFFPGIRFLFFSSTRERRLPKLDLRSRGRPRDLETEGGRWPIVSRGTAPMLQARPASASRRIFIFVSSGKRRGRVRVDQQTVTLQSLSTRTTAATSAWSHELRAFDSNKAGLNPGAAPYLNAMSDRLRVIRLRRDESIQCILHDKKPSGRTASARAEILKRTFSRALLIDRRRIAIDIRAPGPRGLALACVLPAGKSDGVYPGR